MNRLTVVLSALALAGTAAECEAMRALKVRTLAMATPFRQFINDRLVKYLASEQITVTHKKSLGIERNTEIRRQPIPNTIWRARPISNAKSVPTAFTSPAAAGAASIASIFWSAIWIHGGDVDECLDLERHEARQAFGSHRGLRQTSRAAMFVPAPFAA